MKFHKLFTLLVVAAMLLAFAPAASAQQPVGDWVSGISCQNLDETNAADITLEFYNEDTATIALTYHDSIVAGGFKGYYTPDTPVGVPDNFLGSVMIQSSAPLACNVNTQVLMAGAGTAANPNRVATSAGFGDAETSTVMYAPQVMSGYYTWNSYIAVQNATDAEISVTLTYKSRAGADVAAANETVTIPGYSNHVFYQAENAGLPDNFVGAATITGTGAVAVTVNFYNDGTAAGTSQMHSYNGFSVGDTTLLVPRFVRRYYGYNSGLTIQNIGAAATTATITFTFNGVNYTHTTDPIQVGAALVLYATDIDELDVLDAGEMRFRSGNAVVTAAENIIAIVNEDNRGLAADNGGAVVPATRIGQGSTYNAFTDASKSNDIFFAQITDLPAYFWAGGYQIANTTNVAGTCTATFPSAGGLVVNYTLPASGSISQFAPNVVGLDTYNAAVVVNCTQPVVGISNLAYTADSGLLGDSFTTANGLNR